jgi:anti-sigma B factor antagonist
MELWSGAQESPAFGGKQEAVRNVGCVAAFDAVGWSTRILADSAVADSARAAEERVMQLKLTKRTVDGILAIGCSGRIVFGEESSLLREEVKKAIADGYIRIVLNLGEVNYIDSGGLGTLVALHTTAHNAGATIKLANLTKRVGDLLQVTKLLTVFEVHNSEYEALEAFRQAA